MRILLFPVLAVEVEVEVLVLILQQKENPLHMLHHHLLR
jgi:hypothetical protein